MNHLKPIRLVLGLALASCLAAADDSALPPVQHQGTVSYIAGGIGLDESQAIKAAIPRYALSMQFAVNRNGKDEFGADAQIEIHDASGATVLTTQADGPYLLVDLPSGHYSIQASISGHAQHKDVDLVHGENRKAIFVWPSAQVDGAGN